MRVRYWREGGLEREEVVESPEGGEALPQVVVRPFGVMAVTEVALEARAVLEEEYVLMGAMEHRHRGVLWAEYVWRGYRLRECPECGGGCG